MLQRLSQLQQLLKRTSSGAWIPEIDGLRFIAILPVVLQHLLERFYRATDAIKPDVLTDDSLAYFISRGTVGVFLFFAISGFVLALPFARHAVQGTPRIPLKQYFLRRLTRIEPPYLFWMTIFALVLLVKGDYLLPDLFKHWLASITYTHNLIFKDYTRINPVAWSLEVEIQFYLIAPLLAFLYFRIQHKMTRRIGLLLGLVGVIALQTGFGLMPFQVRTSLAGQIQHFMIGFLLVDFYLTDWKDGVTKSMIWDLLALGAFVTMCYTWSGVFSLNLLFTLALLTLFIAAFRSVYFRALISQPWIAITGGMCYTIYLTHLPLLQALTPLTSTFAVGHNFWMNYLIQLAILLPIVWGTSAMFYLAIEKPFMQRRFPKLSIKLNTKRLRQLAAVLVLFAFSFVHPLHAQQENFDFSQPQALKLRPVAELSDIAIQNAPELKAKQVDLEKQALVISIQRRSWADLLALSMGGIYGNGSALDANSDAFGTRYLITDRKTSGLNVSFSVKITGGDLLTRGQRVQLQRLQVDRLLEEQESLKLQIRSALIAMYFQTQQALQILSFKAQSVENMRFTLEIAEKYFKEGNYKPDEYSVLLEKSNTANELYMQAQVEAKKQILLLREFVGAEVLVK
ncbi:MAG: acyltransferase family protein [Bacteroidota bacterium]